MATANPSTPAASTSMPPPTMQEFLGTVPSPLTTALVGLGPCISRVRRFAEIVSWKSTWEEGWLALAAWWAICILANSLLRYALPVAAIAVICWRRWKSSSSSPAPPITEQNLQSAISDLTTIHTLLIGPARVSSFTSPTSLPILTVLRVCCVLYLPYLVLTCFIRIRILLGIAGTFFLTHRAPWATVIRHSLWRSAYIRWSCYKAWFYISGAPLPPHITPQSTSLSAANVGNQESVSSLRFLFAVYENQRWWMGLDWTAALLPGERPSWCSALLQPVAPPTSFTLPEATTVYMNVPDHSSRTKGKTKRVKRTATWKWEESEWRVLIKKEGGGRMNRVERPLPSPLEKEEGTGSRILNLKRLSQGSVTQHPEGEGGIELTTEGEGQRSGEDEEDEQEHIDEPVTDADGWVYLDNKWENPSAKGGMGKYTRYRRWTRIALLIEVVEEVEPGETGVLREEPQVPEQAPPEEKAAHAPQQEPHSPTDEKEKAHEEEERSSLRQRIRAAVQRSSSRS